MRNLVAGIIVSLGLSLPVLSQNINMSNGSTTACSGTFYDNGGNGNYSNNQTLTYTICPSVAGNRVLINFTSFALENNYDFLTIYDGNSTSAPSLGTYTGTSGPGLVSATSSNSTGCLTFVFTSNSSGVAAGWQGAISCAAPCQNITANLVSSTPAIGAGGVIRICQGQSVTFNGSGTFSNSGAGAVYQWNFGDGSSGTGTSVTHTYPNPGSYLVNLNITDPSNCHNSNSINQIVQVSTTPVISLSASPANLCVGATSALTATVTPTPFSANCTPPVSGTTFLPDGTGVSYTTSVNVSCYASGQTLSNGNDIQSICLNLEHSYLGDLRIRLICPNGQSMVLKAYPGGGGTYLGSPLDDPAIGPGSGFTYCFTPSATTLLVNGPTVTAGSPAGNSKAPGDYMPVDPFSNMVGCPLNGAWTIEVTDNLAIDNGYIFNWDVNFVPGLAPPNLSFTPAIVSQGWVPAAGLSNVSPTQANVTPSAPGSNCYTYSVTDNFGCTYTQNICVNAMAGPVLNVTPASITICEGQNISFSASGATSYAWSGPNSFSAGGATINIPAATVAAGGTYTVNGVNASGCTTSVTRNAIVNPIPATPNFTTNSPLCTGNTLNLSGPNIPGATYIWSGPNGFSSSLQNPSIPSVSTAASGTYSLYVVVNGCTSATATQNVSINPIPATPNFTTNSPVCAGFTLNFNAPTIAGATYVWNGPNGFSSSIQNPSISSVTSAASGTYSLYIVVNGCTSATATQNVTINPIPATPNFSTNAPLCQGQQLDLYGPNVAGASYYWSGPNGFTQSGTNANVGNVTVANAGTYSLYVVVNGCTSATATQNVSINPTPATPNFTTNSPVCAGFTLNFNAPTIAGATYVWNGPNGFTSALEDPSIPSVTTAASGNYSLYVVVNGCTSATATQNVTINPIPATPNFTTNSPVCAGFTLQLNGPAIAGATYVWSGPNGFSSSIQNPSIASAGTAASGTYSLYVIVNGCTSATATQNVTVYPIPAVPNFTTNSPVCAGFTLNFNAPTIAGATYVWSGPNGFTSALEDPSIPSVTSAASGTYSLYVVVNGCTSATAMQNVTINPIPATPNFTTNSPVCAGFTLNFNAPTIAGATYVWSGPNGFTSALEDPSISSVTTAASGTYSLYVVVNGCTSATATQNVTVNPVPATPNFSTNAPVCAGNTLNLNGPDVPGATYVWSGPNGFTSSLEDPSIPSAGTAASGLYSLYVIVNGCTSATATLNAVVNPLPAVNAGPDQSVCIGAAVTLSGSGAVSYVWDNGVTDGVAFNPTATTTYTVIGTDANGCQNTDQLTVTVNQLPVVDAGADQTICIGASVTLSGSGAVSYAWDNGATDGVAFNPTATTTYTVIGTDANGCQNTDQLTVTVNPLPLVDAGVDQTICIGASVTLSGSGAVSYVWDNGVTDGVAFNPTATTTYTVTGTDANGCQNTDQLTVTVNPLPVVDAGADQTICIGAAVTLNASGAVSYVWDNGVTDGVAFNPTATTTYTVIGTDANGCQNTDQLTITVNPLPLVDAGADQTICIGASVTLSGSGAVAYAWDNGVTDGLAFNPTATTTYTVIGTDANGCQNTDQLTVTVNPLPLVDAGVDQTICIGSSVTLSGSGAISYVWDNGVTDGVAFNPTATTTYTVIGTDANGCQNTDQLTITVNPLPLVDAGVDQTICIGAAVTLNASGAVSYVWDNGVSDGVAFNPTATTTYTVIGTDANGCQNSDQLTVTVNPLPVVDAGADQTICIGASVTLSASGAVSYAWDNGVTDGVAFNPTATTTYTVIGTDVNSCQNTDQLTVTVNPLPIVNAGADQTICIGAAVTLNASGAVSYAWDNGVTDGVAFNPTATTTYTVIGTDANGCQNTDQLTVTVNPLPIVDAGTDQTICIGASVTLSASGAVSYVWDNGVNDGVAFNPTTTTTYTVIGTDANGCQNTDQLTVTVNPLPIVDAGTDQTICIGASATLNASGAVSYVWDNGVNDGVAFNPTTTTTYTVIGTDANGCQNTDQLTITVNPLPVVDAGADQTICIGASVTLSGSGAVSYVWDNGVNDGVAFNPTTTTTYTVIGTDANGCQNTDQLTVTVNPLPIVDAGPDQTICIGASVTLNASGAVSYVWDNGVTDGVAFNPTVTTTYTVIGTDANGCQNTDQLTVTVNPLPVVNAGTDQTICIGASVTLSGSGAVSYVWDNGVTDGVAFNPTATTTYTVTGTDANGCQNTDQLTVTVNPLPVVDAGADQTICIGASVTLNASGAVSYAWDNGVTDGVAFNPTATTTYTVIGTDANGCQNTDQLTVTVNPLPVVNAGADQTICIGASVTLSASGAVTYVWDNGVNDGVAFNPTTTTTYTVIGTDANGCQNTDQLTVTVNPLPVVDAGADQTICIGASVTLSGSGAVSYAWDNGATDGVAFNPTATTTYTVIGTDANGCQNTDQLTVTVNPLPLVDAGVDQTICIGASVTLSGSGAVSYVWDNGVTDGVAFNPTATTTYTVIGTDANGCQNTDQLTVTVNPLPLVDAGVDQTICIGASVTLSGSGAVSYVWDNGVSDGIAFNPTATTTYTVIGTDANGCQNTDQLTITVNPLPVVDAGADQTICIGASVTLSASGAVSYAWDNGVTDGVAFNPTATTTYTVIGTDANGCQNSDQLTVTVNPLPIVGAGADQTICIGASVTLSGSGAVSYAWDNGATDGVAFNPTATTTYTVIGTDANGCQNTDQLTVTVNPLPIVDAGADQTICIGASVTLSASGAVSYAWDNGVTDGVAFNPTATTTYTVIGTDANGCQNTDQLTVTVNPLPIVDAGADQTICIGASVTLSASGAVSYAWDNGVSDGVAFNPTVTTTYTVIGTDANGCQNTDQLTVTVNPLPIVDAGADQTICIGASVTLSASGAVSYVWDNGVTDGVAFNPTVTTTYTVIGTDANGCQNTDQLTVTVNPLPIVDAGVDQTICIGASVTLSASGAVSYVWDNGATDGVAFNPATTTTYTVIGTDVNGCQNTDQLTVTVNPLPIVGAGADQTICIGASVTLSGSGAVSYIWDNGVSDGVAFNPTVTTTYTVIGTDANGCQNTDQLTVTVNPLPLVDAGADQTICIGAAVTLNASGAVSYVWDNGVTDGVAFNPTATTTYTVIGTDANGCQNTDQLTVTVNPLPIVDAGTDQTICIGASVTLNASGAVSYVWDNGVTDGVAFNPTATTTYTVIGTDANGCQNTDQLTVTVNPLPIVDAGADQTICIGASLTLNASGAVSYAWDNGVTDGVAFNPTATTTYTVIGTDANGCQNTDQLTVTVNPLPIVDAGADQTICIGAAVTLNASGAVSYAWDNGVNDGVAFNPTATTTYTVIGTDANGCQNTDQLTVTVNPLPLVDAGVDQTICIGAAVTLNASGAVSYVWDNGVTDGVAFNPTATTTYTVIGTDANGCQNTDQLTVTVNPLPLIDAGVDQTICIGASVTLSASGAVSYVWDNGVTDGVAFNPTATTTYTVIGTDANGCQNTDQLTVTVNPLPIVDAGADQTICIGASVTLSASGAVSYAWDNGVSDGVAFNPTVTTTYTVIGTDANGCQNTDQLTVTVNPLPIVDAGADQTICIGASVTLSASGAVSYVWDNGVTDGVAFNPTATTTYTVIGTDANGCQNSDQLIITVNTIPPTPFINAATDYCSGDMILLDAGTIAGASYYWGNPAPLAGTEDLSIINSNIAHSGTYSLYVVVNGCTSSTAQHTLTVHPVYTRNIQVNICEGSSYSFLGVTYQNSGQYPLNLQTVHGCDSIITLHINLMPQPIAGFDIPEQISASDPTIDISDASFNATGIQYILSSGDVYYTGDVTHTFMSPGQYTVMQLVSNGSCTDSLSKQIYVSPVSQAYIPNSFSPDGDGINDEWKPVISYAGSYSLLIFDRWGELIFESDDVYKGWNGSFRNIPEKPVQLGTYVYKIHYRDFEGNEKELLGHINLLR